VALNPSEESYLNLARVPWRYEPAIPLTQIDVGRSRSNEGRPNQKLDKDRALTMAVQFLDGARFPAILVYAAAGKFVIVDGNHRDAALREAGEKTTDAYVLETLDELVLDRLTLTRNCLNGQSLDEEARCINALKLLQKFPQDYTREAVAKLCGLKVGRLREYQQGSETLERIHRLLPHDRRVQKLSISGCAKLHSIRDDAVLVAFIKLQLDMGAGRDRLRDLLTAIKAAPDAAAQQALIEAFRHDHLQSIAHTAGGTIELRQRPVYERAMDAMRKLHDLLKPYVSLEELGAHPGREQDEWILRFQLLVQDEERLVRGTTARQGRGNGGPASRGRSARRSPGSAA